MNSNLASVPFALWGFDILSLPLASDMLVVLAAGQLAGLMLQQPELRKRGGRKGSTLRWELCPQFAPGGQGQLKIQSLQTPD
jgi:hypothetical protein